MSDFKLEFDEGYIVFDEDGAESIYLSPNKYWNDVFGDIASDSFSIREDSEVFDGRDVSAHIGGIPVFVSGDYKTDNQEENNE